MYNEMKRIKTVSLYLNSIRKYFDSKKKTYEIIIVLDGPTDGTPDYIKKLKFSNLKIIDRKKNKGKGASVKQGLLAAKGKICMFADADGSTPIKEFSKAEKFLLTGFDVVIGSRKLKDSVIFKKQNKIRKTISNAGGFLIHSMLGLWKIKDTQCGFKVFSKKAVKKIFHLQTIDRWGFDFEILTIAKEQSLSIKEIPVIWNDVEDSNISFSSFVTTFKELIQVFINRLLRKYK